MIGLYFGGQNVRNYFGNQFGNIELDVMLDEKHEWAADATSFPVEEGSPITDHVIEQADKLMITGFISDTPIIASVSVTKLIGERTQGVFDLLNRLIKLREPITVYTKYRAYINMIMTKVDIPRTAGQGEAIEFTAEFINIRKVATQIVGVPKGISSNKKSKTSKALGNKTEPKKTTGKKQPVTVTKPSSALSRIFK